jgi:hypothetical protein
MTQNGETKIKCHDKRSGKDFDIAGIEWIEIEIERWAFQNAVQDGKKTGLVIYEVDCDNGYSTYGDIDLDEILAE